MNNKEKKLIKEQYARKNIDKFLDLLETRFNSNFDSLYIREIKRFSEGFNIRLKREQKLKFCKKCETYWDVNTREIRLNKLFKTKDYICKNCGAVKRFKYK